MSKAKTSPNFPRAHRGRIGGNSQVDALYKMLETDMVNVYTALDIWRVLRILNPSTVVSQLDAELRHRNMGRIVRERVMRRVRGEWKKVTAYRYEKGGE